MLVRERMSTQPVTITARSTINDALRAMRQNQIRRLPVLDQDGQMVGIVAEKDLLYASPSPVTSLSIYEMHDMLSRLQVTELMSTEVITISPDTPLEEAARIMVDGQIGALPVMDDGELVGIITETDIFKAFLELLGAREPGIRLTVQVPERKGEIARLTTAIAQRGGDIIALGSFQGEDLGPAPITIKIEDVSASDLKAAMEELDLEILDMREIDAQEVDHG
jgi:acetoin utilization protein AcuB